MFVIETRYEHWGPQGKDFTKWFKIFKGEFSTKE